MIISRTPFRVSFFGGGTDYPSWYRQHGGAVLATTIDKYCYITCRYLPQFFQNAKGISLGDVTITWHRIIIVVVALLCFVLAALNVPSPINLTAMGLFFLTLAMFGVA